MSIKPILFYEKGKEFYEFTNFYPTKNLKVALPEIKTDGTIKENSDPSAVKYWPTSEHLFQALKYTHKPNIVAEILSCLWPSEVFKLTNGRDGTYKGFARNDWKSISVAAMEWVLKQKFSQDPALKKKLVDTGNRLLVEDAGKKDNFWGNGVTGNGFNGNVDKSQGRNKLGELLIELRTQLRSLDDLPPPPDDDWENQFVTGATLDSFEVWIEGKLGDKGLKRRDLSSEFQDWWDHFAKLKNKEVGDYKKKVEKEIERVEKVKNDKELPPKPSFPTPKVSTTHREKVINKLEEEIEKYDFGAADDEVIEVIENIKSKIRSEELQTQSEVDGLTKQAFKILEKNGKKKSSNIPPTPSDNSSLLEELRTLDEKNIHDFKEETRKKLVATINSLSQYFKENHITVIVLKANGDMMDITYRDKSTESISVNSPQLRQVKEYMEDNDKSFLSAEELTIVDHPSPNNKNLGQNYLPYVLLGGGIVLIFIVVAVIIKKKRNK